MTTKKNFNENLLEVLVCPVTKTRLTYDKRKQELISNKAKLALSLIHI